MEVPYIDELGVKPKMIGNSLYYILEDVLYYGRQQTLECNSRRYVTDLFFEDRFYEFNPDIDRVIDIDETTLLLDRKWDTYGHWLLEIYPVLFAAHLDGVKYDKILTRRNATFKTMLMDTLSKTDACINAKFRTAYRFKKLIVSVDKRMEYMRARYKPLYAMMKRYFVGKSDLKIGDRLYLSRQHLAPARSISNEHEIYPLLSEQGFQKIIPEEYNIYDQAAMIYHAKVIFSAHGSALANMIFGEGLTIIEPNNGWNEDEWSVFAKLLGHKHHLLYEASDMNGQYIPIHVNRNRLERILKSV